MSSAGIVNARRLYRLKRPDHEAGHCYISELPQELPLGDSMHEPFASRVELFEDGRPLGPAHSQHDEIRQFGLGRFSHWHRSIYFSTSDNSDARKNRRDYDLYVPAGEPHADALPQATVGTAWDTYGLAEARFYEVFPNAFIGEFGKACWEDSEFVADYLRLVPGNRRSFERKYVVAQFVRAVKHVMGDLAECGVYNAATAYFMARASEAVGRPRRLHLFDSFDGLSHPGAEDGTYWQAGALAISEATARRNLAGVPDVSFYRGWIPDRFPEVADRQFAFVHIDVDLYQPTLDSLRFFYDRTAAGGVLLCDDYGFITCPGAARAMREFMADKQEEIIHLPTGQGVVLKA
jgi:hypothetical protein